MMTQKKKDCLNLNNFMPKVFFSTRTKMHKDLLTFQQNILLIWTISSFKYAKGMEIKTSFKNKSNILFNIFAYLIN